MFSKIFYIGVRLIPPIILSYMLFLPFNTINLDWRVDGVSYIPQDHINSSLSLSLLADSLGFSNGVGFYKICWVNEGAVVINGNNFLSEKDKIRLIPGTVYVDEIKPGTVQVDLRALRNSEFVSTTTLSAEPGSEDCHVFRSNIDGINVYQTVGTTTYYIGRPGGAFTEGAIDLGEGQFKTEIVFDFGKLSLVAKNYFPAVLFKTFLLIIFWIGLLGALCSLRRNMLRSTMNI